MKQISFQQGNRKYTADFLEFPSVYVRQAGLWQIAIQKSCPETKTDDIVYSQVNEFPPRSNNNEEVNLIGLRIHRLGAYHFGVAERWAESQGFVPTVPREVFTLAKSCDLNQIEKRIAHTYDAILVAMDFTKRTSLLGGKSMLKHACAVGLRPNATVALFDAASNLSQMNCWYIFRKP